MKKIATISSFLLLGTIGFFVSNARSAGNINLDYSDEDFHLYL